MWFKLAGADFSKNNLGTMSSISSSYLIDYTGLTGMSGSPSSVSYAGSSAGTSKTASVVVTVTSGYTFKQGSTITASGGKSGTVFTADKDYTGGQTFTFSMAITANTKLTGAAEATGGSSSGGGEPETPTNYTFTINPTPTSATVTLSATGYSTVSGTGSKSITVANGTTVNWSVSANGYTTRTGNATISGSNKTESITLTSGGTSEYDIYDSFDRDNTDDGIGSTDTGEVWENVIGPNQTGAMLKIYNGKVKGHTKKVYPSAVVRATNLDRYVEMEIATGASSGQFLLYDKYYDATNYVALRKGTDGLVTLLKKVEGVNTEIVKTTEQYIDDNTVFAIQCVGNTHTIFVNGVQILTGEISDFATATKVGFSINETAIQADNFKVKYL